MNARKTSEYLPMTGKILRKKKGVYVVVIKFVKSKRIYATEEVRAPNQKRVKELLRFEHPHIHWSKK